MLKHKNSQKYDVVLVLYTFSSPLNLLPSILHACVRACASLFLPGWRLLVVTAYRSDFPSSFLAIFTTVRTTPVSPIVSYLLYP